MNSNLPQAQLSYWIAFKAIFVRELKLAWQKPSQIIQPMVFFLIVVTLFPLGISPAPKTLQMIGPGVIWIAALLAIMLVVDRLFRQDFQEGTIEAWLLSTVPMSLLVAAKLLAAWFISCSVLLLISPVLALLMNVESQVIPALMLSLLIGTPILLFVGAIGNALTVSLNQGGVLLSLLVLPLYIPVLIFATSLIEAASFNMDYSGQLAILVSMLLVSCFFAPVAIAAALKNTVN
ncbi:heme exporter protein CcmB [uncultured Psychrosphaera sp.]|jgi:heme exporter protein B|uniref:heme exporter protein CcmB n=1 Tax=uncultured Psychrosphaera sp. TaxID=1403522 RepID=UPI002626E573|nr:heme exporter protein CcmB [uncultured Psychrosphaera sp.]